MKLSKVLILFVLCGLVAPLNADNVAISNGFAAGLQTTPNKAFAAFAINAAYSKTKNSRFSPHSIWNSYWSTWREKPKTALCFTVVALGLCGGIYYFLTKKSEKKPKNKKKEIKNNQNNHDDNTKKNTGLNKTSDDKIKLAFDDLCNALRPINFDQRFIDFYNQTIVQSVQDKSIDVTLPADLKPQDNVTYSAEDCTMLDTQLKALALALQLVAPAPFEDYLKKQEKLEQEKSFQQSVAHLSDDELYDLGKENVFAQFSSVISEFNRRINSNQNKNNAIYWLGLLYKKHYEENNNTDSKKSAIQYFNMIPHGDNTKKQLARLGVKVDLSTITHNSILSDLGKENYFAQFEQVISELENRINDINYENKDDAIYWLGYLYFNHYEKKNNTDSKKLAIKYFKMIPNDDYAQKYLAELTD